MKEIDILIAKILDILIGIPQKDIEIVLPIIYDTKMSFSVYMETKNIQKVWGYSTSFQYQGKIVKIIDLSLIWGIGKGIHKFKYILACKGIAIKVDDIVKIETFSLGDLYLFPSYLQRILNFKYIWGIAKKEKDYIYLMDPEIFKKEMGEVHEKIL